MSKPKLKEKNVQQIEIEGKVFKVIQPRARDLIKLTAKYSEGTPEEIADKMSEHVMLNWVIEPKITIEMYDDPKNAKIFTILAGKLLEPLIEMSKKN
ncbi:MAG: hypothetical protein ACFFCS_27385 [Candidatus Hodarchaeota archaeon]